MLPQSEGIREMAEELMIGMLLVFMLPCDTRPTVLVTPMVFVTQAIAAGRRGCRLAVCASLRKVPV